MGGPACLLAGVLRVTRRLKGATGRRIACISRDQPAPDAPNVLRRLCRSLRLDKRTTPRMQTAPKLAVWTYFGAAYAHTAVSDPVSNATRRHSVPTGTPLQSSAIVTLSPRAQEISAQIARGTEVFNGPKNQQANASATWGVGP